MSVTRFCEAEGISQPSFYQWRKRLGSVDDAAGKARPVFQQVVVTPSATAPACLRVRLASGAEIEVEAAHLEVIRAVVGELARAECEFAAGEEAPFC
jgi:hypothetical protein